MTDPGRAGTSKQPWQWLIGWASPFRSASAFEELYAQTHLRVYRYVFGLLAGSQAEAEDVTAETYLRAWQHRASYAGDRGSALSWLLGIARHLVIDGYRRTAAHGPTSELDERHLAAPGGSAEEQVLANQALSRLASVLLQLPAEERELVTLRFLLGWRVKEIAAHLGQAENTVSVRLRRVLARLRLAWRDAE